MSPGEFLATDFGDWEPEYVHGEVVERPVPNRDHSRSVMLLGFNVERFHRSHGLSCYPELRLKLAEDIYRTPDMSIYQGKAPDLLPATPPLAVAEILSPGDRWSDVLKKLDEYAEWGVLNIWVIDPLRRALMVYEHGSIQAVDALTLPGYPVQIRYSDLTG